MIAYFLRKSIFFFFFTLRIIEGVFETHFNKEHFEKRLFFFNREKLHFKTIKYKDKKPNKTRENKITR